jgi:hypothetical protein
MFDASTDHGLPRLLQSGRPAPIAEPTVLNQDSALWFTLD